MFASSRSRYNNPAVLPPDSLAEAYAACARVARTHYENFPVASVLLPGRMRPHVAAVYAFARGADDFADEGDLSPDDRLRRLDDWHQRLLDCTCVDPAPCTRHPAPNTRHPAPGTRHPGPELVFLALGHTIRTCQLPLSPFEDLLSAFRQDVTKRGYATWDELLDYCRRSANPIGRLVLRVAGYSNERLDRASDCLCTALQLTNLWQDLHRDCRRGRQYLPADIRRRCGARDADLEQGQLSPEWKQALAEALSFRHEALRPRGNPTASFYDCERWGSMRPARSRAACASSIVRNLKTPRG